jgi:two-component system, sensor histidine kinase and response regulator
MNLQNDDFSATSCQEAERLNRTIARGNIPPIVDESELHPGNIMIVDDHPGNLKVLGEMLRWDGYAVRSFLAGRLALAAVDEEPPDLILLDINMPEMNGYEVCERLKSNADYSHIPVIFLSGRSEIEDKVAAFRSGAVDYISKPFQFQEVHARVEAHLKLHALRRALKRQNEHLEEAVKARTCELAEANTRLAEANARLAILDHSKSEFLNLISHEFRTPLNGILGVGELILDGSASNEDQAELRELFNRSRRRILSILDDALLLTQIDVNGEQFKPAPVSLHAALSVAIEKTTDFAASLNVFFQQPPACPELVLADEALLVRALQSLLKTAVKFSNANEAVKVSTHILSGWREVTIESLGKTVPIPLLEKFFDLFSISEDSTPGRDLGLAPSMAHRILSLFGASVTVENCDPSGIRLVVSFTDINCPKASPVTALWPLPSTHS